MINFLVETKQEYTTQLINILTPIIYEGLQSIYQEVIKISTPDNILKNFQIFMQRIPKWNNEMIHNETQRIMNNSKSYAWLEDLIKATLKANIIVLTYNPNIPTQVKVDPSLYQNIKIDDFVHKIYIECARELWNNPYLFYHNYPPIELKRNQRDSILLIKDCIKEAIRKLLPLKHILNIYLGEEMEVGIPDHNFDKSISEIEGNNLNKLIKKDLYLDMHHRPTNLPELSYKPSNSIFTVNDTKPGELTDITQRNPDILKGGLDKIDEIDDKSEATVGSKILDIINKKDIKLTDNKTSDTIVKKNIDDSETSLSANNGNFQEIFSNNNTKIEEYVPQKENKEKFFSNYLKLKK